MRTLTAVVFAALASMSCVACGGGSGARRGAGGSLDAYRVPQEKQDEIRAKDKEENARKDADEDEALDTREKTALRAFKQALGNESAHRGTVPESSSTVVLALRRSPIKVRLEPITDDDGNALSDDFVTLRDSYTDRVRQLQRKLTEQSASKAEIREIQDGSRYLMKVSDLRMEVGDISTQAFDANLRVQLGTMGTMVGVASLVGRRRTMEMPLDDDDYGRVMQMLERMRRSEAIAASLTGMLAAYEAVLNGGGDPKALDAIASTTIKAFPLKPTVTMEDAKQYVSDVKGDLGGQKARYERMLRATYGDATYEEKFKERVDTMFAIADSMQSRKSTREIMAERQTSRADADGTSSHGSVAAPSSPAQAAALATPGATDPVAPNASPTVPPSRVGQGLGVAAAASRGNVSGALDGAAQMFPSDGAIGSSLAGVAALSKGDPRGAINAALNLVPGGSLVKDGLSVAANLLFGTSKKG